MRDAGTTEGVCTPEDADSRRSALLVSTLSSFITPFMGSSVVVALPSIGREFGMDAVTLSWVATSYILAAAVFLVPFGRVADIYGRKRIFSWGMAIYTASSLLSAVSMSPLILIVSRVLQGVGSAMVFGTGMAILTSVFRPHERGRVLGINVAAVYSGLSAGPFVGGFLTQHFGWRSIFLAGVPLGLLVLLAVFLRLRGEWAGARGEKLDVAGSVTYGLAFVAIMYGFSLLPAPTGALLLAAGLAGMAAFIRWEARIEHPVMDIGLFRGNVVFAFSNLAALINYSATSAVTFLLSLNLQYAKGLSPRDAGMVLVSQPLMMALVSPFAGRLSDRTEPRVVASIGMGIIVVGLLLLSLVGGQADLRVIVGCLLLLGLGFGLFSSPNTNAVMSSVDKRDYGIASGTLGTMRLSGQMISMAVATLILAVYVGHVQITPLQIPLFLTSLRVSFAVFAALCGVGVFASLARGKVR